MEKAIKEMISRYYPDFQTQREAIDYVREGLSHHIGESVNSSTEPEYYQELLVLLGSHPDFDHKFNGINVSMINPLYNERDDVFILDLVTNVGHLDVSWRKCAVNLVRIEKGKVLDPQLVLRRSVLRAMRLAVQEQMQDFRKKYKQNHHGKYVNELNGHWLPAKYAVVDHYPKSFSQIADEWLDHIGGVEQVKLLDRQGYRGKMMADRKQRISWKMYHLVEARYRIISAKQNAANGAYGYKPRN